jgi:arabinofuranosyltransferase
MSDRAPARGFAVALGAGLALYAWLWWRLAFVCDDAYISLRYARHLAAGIGLRFNAVESPPVEGYSNLLWVLWLALFERLGIDGPRAAIASSALCGAALLVLVLRFARARLALEGAGLAATALAAASLPPFVVWASGGLETMACALAAFAAFDALARDPLRPRALAAGLCGAAAALLRVDGPLWALLALCAAWVAAPDGRRAATLRAGLGALALVLAAFVAQTAFRLGYHGDWIPNTARAKGGLSALRLERGAKYVGALLAELPFLLLLPLAASRTRVGLACAAFALATAGYAAFVGGDFMAMGRFLVPAMPFVALCFALLAARLERRPVALAALTLAVVGSSLLAAFDAAPVPQRLRQALHFRWNEPLAKSEARQRADMQERAQAWAQIGRAVGACVAPGKSLVLPNLGAISYYSEVHALDPFGLIDPEIARREAPARRVSPGHDKAVPSSYFHARRPDYLGAWIAPAGAPPETGLPPGFAGSELARVAGLETHALGEGLELRLLRVDWAEAGR